jgi:hypothetical protein
MAPSVHLVGRFRDQKILKPEAERRSRLNENFGPPQKAHQPIMSDSNALRLSDPVCDEFGKSHFKMTYKSNEFRIHYHGYHEFCFHNCLLVIVSGS